MPNSQTRWDSPLFVIQKGDELPKQKITDALFSRKAPPPNMSTQSQPLSSTNFLYDLDCVTNNTIKTIMQSQSSSVPGDQLTIPGVEEKYLIVTYHYQNYSGTDDSLLLTQKCILSKIRRDFLLCLYHILIVILVNNNIFIFFKFIIF
ncbi:protein KTI12 homolog isoform X1 [Octopus bimaculoides]|uniref:protein KTI12 homolog isoform X1 n=1 Tax=Octopus bimaculoides TaxID=37653 RepID=UPI0022E42BA6|nr:protein KTI12 homolog isoform X1 [Octopus bimaculoides]XP_052829790.1 protein KTI12 homolog isoform X1 [Octopus bimaculoides]XP_052829791.1 protein KTI12 homolog isoform X1 [Octopus bimaculoides]XP_052829792.1 protein KTI12 homolog isoform X1 [Octopus bimaculoides]